MIPTTAEAVAASVVCAAELGLPSDNPVVVAEGYSVRVRLDPAPVLTRVVTTGQILRGDPLPWMQREVAVAEFLTAAGVKVASPWHPAGPHLANGVAVSLWKWLEPVPFALPPREFSSLLYGLHRALASYKQEPPLLVGPLTDITAALALHDDPVLHEAAEWLLPLAETWPRRPLHGDMHPGNLLGTSDGPHWIDFEDVCVGPLEWDLASRSLSDEYVDAYPGRLDRKRLEECRDLRRLQILACVLSDDLQDASLYDELTAQLRRHHRGRTP